MPNQPPAFQPAHNICQVSKPAVAVTAPSRSLDPPPVCRLSFPPVDITTYAARVGVAPSPRIDETAGSPLVCLSFSQATADGIGSLLPTLLGCSNYLLW